MNYQEKIKEKINTLLKHTTPHDNQQLYMQLCNYEASSNIQAIIQTFFLEHIVYYIQTSGLYVYYKRHQYVIFTEDDILHLIFNNLNVYPLYTSIKQQIKQKIHKKIKESSLYNTIPDSVTLQNVISFLHPLFFPTKNGSKYFMTILGDIIMKKTNLYYFLDHSMKPFIKKLQKLISIYFCSNQLAQFKFKFCDHPPELSRLIKTNPINFTYIKCDESFYINLICCSIHYSNRFNNGDIFLEDMTNQTLRQEVLWIKETKKEDVLKDFIESYFHTSDSEIHEKDMNFLWKLYLKQKNCIHLLQKNIQDDLSQLINYNAPYFINITSMKLPFVKKFNSFWNKYMYEDKTEKYLELTEILSLFIEHNQKYHDMNEQKIKDILQYYYPDIFIVENRYINNMGCLLWNKKEDLSSFFKSTTCKEDLYRAYTESPVKPKVSKQYFTMYQESL
jgi:hypothetical protein